MNAIFCSAGRRVELLRAFKAAYAELGLQGSVIALDVDFLAPALRVADRHYVVPRLNAPSFDHALLAICEREAPAVVFPLIDPDIPVLARLRDAMRARGAHLAGIVGDAVAITEDKWKTRAWFQSLGLRTPASWLPETRPAGIAYPVFVKPRRGSAGQHSYKVTDGAWLDAILATVPEPIIQEFMSTPEVTTDVVCDPEGNVLAVVSRRRLEVRSGEVSKGVTMRDERIEEACCHIARALGARGPITVQCFLTDDGPVFSEINARLGGGFPLGVAAGANSPKWLLARAAGMTIDVPPIGTYRTGVYMSRYDESLILDSIAIDHGPRVSV